MKVEWLNKERTHARLTKGFFRKLVAEVRRHDNGQWWYDNKEWVEKDDSGDYPKVEYMRDNAIAADKRAAKASAWKPITKLPEARIVR